MQEPTVRIDPMTQSVRRVAPRRRGSIGCTVFLVVFTLIGVAIIVVLLSLYARHSASHQWPQVPCTIVSSGVVGESGPDSTGPYRLDLRYRYEFAGTQHEGTRLRLDDLVNEDAGELWRIAHRYSAGDRLACFVDPDDHSVAVLEPGGGRILLFIAIVPAVAILIGIVGIVLFVKGVGAPHESRESGKSHAHSVLASRGGTNLSRVAILCLFGFFLCFGGMFPYFFYIRPAMLAYETRSWTPVDCVVIASDVRTHRGSDSTTYSADILYEYQVRGITYRNSRVTTSAGSTSNHGHWADLVRKHPQGHRTTCVVDPTDPYRSILDPSPPAFFSLALISFFFPLVGLIGVIGVFISMRNAWRRSDADRPTSDPASVGDRSRRGADDPWRSPLADPSTRADAADGSAATTLRPKGSRVVKAVALTGFALVWNGLVWALLVPEVLRGWSSGISLGTVLFTGFGLIFVTVGVLVIGLAIHAILAIANPRVTLRPAGAWFRLGEPMRIDWECSGGRRRIRHLSIELVGRESATYTHGSSTQTARHEFFKRTLVDTDDPQTIAFGTFTIVPPAEGVPSFKASRNAIEWLLRIKGEIPRWPDENDEYAIEVLGPDPRRSSPHSEMPSDTEPAP